MGLQKQKSGKKKFTLYTRVVRSRLEFILSLHLLDHRVTFELTFLPPG